MTASAERSMQYMSPDQLEWLVWGGDHQDRHKVTIQPPGVEHYPTPPINYSLAKWTVPPVNSPKLLTTNPLIWDTTPGCRTTSRHLSQRSYQQCHCQSTAYTAIISVFAQQHLQPPDVCVIPPVHYYPYILYNRTMFHILQPQILLGWPTGIDFLKCLLNHSCATKSPDSAPSP